MTWLDVVREYFPGLDDKTAGAVLWNCTGFPGFYHGDDPAAYFRQQLAEARDRSGGDALLAMANADADLARAASQAQPPEDGA